MKEPALPKSAQTLVELARDHGWYVEIKRSTEHGANYVTVNVSRKEPFWNFRYVWSNRVGTGTYLLITKLVYRPTGTGWSDSTSVRQAYQTIRANPVQEGEQ